MKQTTFIRNDGHLELITHLLNHYSEMGDFEEIFNRMLSALGEELHCDRVFVYLRSPYLHTGKVPCCWRRNDDIPMVHDVDWKAEPSSLPHQDPLFAAALLARPSIFIDDIETASADIVNRQFERETFGHRALIHAHLCIERKLWGVLQACTFSEPRAWSWEDHQIVEQAIAWFTPLAMEYVNRTLPMN